MTLAHNLSSGQTCKREKSKREHLESYSSEEVTGSDVQVASRQVEQLDGLLPASSQSNQSLDLGLLLAVSRSGR